MYVLAVTRHIGDAEEVEPSAEQERELLDADEGRCEDVSGTTWVNIRAARQSPNAMIKT